MGETLMENIKIVPPRHGLLCQINCVLLAYTKFPDANIYVDMRNSIYSNNGENAFLNFYEKNWTDSDNFKYIKITQFWDEFLSVKNFYDYGRWAVGTYTPRLKPKDDMWNFCNDKYIGVHVRKTDHVQDALILDDKYYFEEMDRQYDNCSYFYLATDDSDFLKKAIDRYGEKLAYQENIHRSDGVVGVHQKYRGSKIGKEVLYDAYSLSKCKALIHTTSNVSFFSLMLNGDLESIRLDKHIEYRQG